MKRGSERQITKDDDFDNEDEGEGTFDGGFPRASDDILSTRRIVRAKRPARAPGSAAPPAGSGGQGIFQAFSLVPAAAKADEAGDGAAKEGAKEGGADNEEPKKLEDGRTGEVKGSDAGDACGVKAGGDGAENVRLAHA